MWINYQRNFKGEGRSESKLRNKTWFFPL